jgi:hypothetical protein
MDFGKARGWTIPILKCMSTYQYNMYRIMHRKGVVKPTHITTALWIKYFDQLSRSTAM